MIWEELLKTCELIAGRLLDIKVLLFCIFTMQVLSLIHGWKRK